MIEDKVVVPINGSINKDQKSEDPEVILSDLIEEHNKEKIFHNIAQITIPFLIAGVGMVGAGILFEEVQDWILFQEAKEIIVLVPSLLGLKGNIEMTLASRLSTQVCLII